MAITTQEIIDKIEITKTSVSIRTVTRVLDGNTLLAEKFHRQTFTGTDIPTSEINALLAKAENYTQPLPENMSTQA